VIVAAASSSGGGHGYNPYRDKGGKFAPGAHKKDDKAGHAKAAAASMQEEHGHRKKSLAVRDKLLAIKAKAEGASPAVRAKLKKEFDELKGQHQEHKANATAARAKREPKIKPTEKREDVNPADTHPSALSKPFSKGSIRSEDGYYVHGLTPEAQREVRGHFDGVASEYFMHPRPGPQSDQLIGYPEEAMGGASGWHMGTGKIAMGHQDINALARHGDSDLEYVKNVVKDGEWHRGFSAYSTMMHETIHDHGPVIYGDHHKTHAEEMTTEMSARQISAEKHGMLGHEIKSSGYDEMINNSVNHVAEVAGVSREKAFDALAKASIEFKGLSGEFSGTGAHYWMATAALNRTGSRNATKKNVEDLRERWSGESRKLVELSSSMSAAGVL
jgi:hypothetical protein